jgi:Tfp pilus assembly protein PilX
MFSSLKKLRNDESGVIMVTVLVVVLIMTVVAIGILGVNISQVSTSESVVDNIRAEQLAIGAFYQYHQQQVDGQNGLSPTTETFPDGKTFTISVDNKGPSALSGSNEIEINVDFGS